MAQYDITTQIEEIAKLREVSITEVVKSFNDSNVQELNGKVVAWNRGTENMVKIALSDEKAKEVRKMAKSKFHWVKEEGEWVVAGNFDGVKAGDKIEVFKVNGQSQTKTIERFSNLGNAYVY